MQMTVDKTGSDESSRQADQTCARANLRLEIRKTAERNDLPSRDSDRIAFGMPEDFALVQNEVNFIERHQRTLRVSPRPNAQPTLPPAAGADAPGAGLVGRRKRLCFLNLHLAIAAFECARAGLVAQHLGSALFAHVSLAQRVSHPGKSSCRGRHLTTVPHGYIS